MAQAEIDTRSIGDLIHDGMREVRRRYHADVYGIAEEASELHPDDEDARDTFIHESVDGSEWVIYYYNARAVALLTDNLDAASDAGALEGSAQIQFETTVAYFAMLRDVEDAIGRRESWLEDTK